MKSFPTIFYVPGNNELRRYKESKTSFDSLKKFGEILKLCERVGVNVKPKKVNGVWIVPLFSWYTPTFSDSWDGDFHYQN